MRIQLIGLTQAQWESIPTDTQDVILLDQESLKRMIVGLEARITLHDANQ